MKVLSYRLGCNGTDPAIVVDGCRDEDLADLRKNLREIETKLNLSVCLSACSGNKVLITHCAKSQRSVAEEKRSLQLVIDQLENIEEVT